MTWRESGLLRFERTVHAWFVQHGIGLLRVSLGAAFLAFGAVKYVPSVSPAEGLVLATVQR